jgi:hypothetical protein
MVPFRIVFRDFDIFRRFHLTECEEIVFLEQAPTTMGNGTHTAASSGSLSGIPGPVLSLSLILNLLLLISLPTVLGLFINS